MTTEHTDHTDHHADVDTDHHDHHADVHTDHRADPHADAPTDPHADVHADHRADVHAGRGAGAGRADRVAIVTGGSQGLGLELAARLAADGWAVVVDARRADRLAAARRRLEAAIGSARVVAVPGDVTDPRHRQQLARAARDLGPIRLVVNNASTLGASPLPPLDELTPEILLRTFDVNVVAPIALVAELAGDLPPGAVILNVTSDAASAAYPGWGGYGASKAALEHAGAVLAAEHPEWRVLSVDPGDMRTEMHQAAFPGEDISDRPPPAERVAALIALIAGDRPSGRYVAGEAS